MPDWSKLATPLLQTITPATAESLVSNYGGTGLGAPASATWPTANLAVFVPFRISEPVRILTMFMYNGTTASGNINVGIYDPFGTRIVSIGTTAQAGTSVLQEFNITDTLLGPGQFYFAAAMDNTTGTVFRFAAPSSAMQLKITGCAEMASAFPLPATATFATPAALMTPHLGLTAQSAL